MKRATPQIDVNFRFGESLLEEGRLEAIRLLISDWAPDLGEMVCDGESVLDIRAPGDLERAVRKEVHKPQSEFYKDLVKKTGLSGSNRISGHLELWRPDKAISVVVQFDEWIMSRARETWYWSNELSFQIRDRTNVSELPARTQNLFREGCRLLTPAYGHAYDREEFEAKNISLKTGRKAIGVNWGKAISGLYWLNYFGRPFKRAFATAEKLEALGPVASRVGEGVLIGFGGDPFSWPTPEYRKSQRRAREVLGPQYFFDRTEPDSPTVVVEEIAQLIDSSPAGPYDPSKPSVLQIHLDEFPEE